MIVIHIANKIQDFVIHMHTCFNLKNFINFIYFRIPNIVEYIQQPLQAGLQDKSAYVRKTAVMGVVKLFYVAPEVVSG